MPTVGLHATVCGYLKVLYVAIGSKTTVKTIPVQKAISTRTLGILAIESEENPMIATDTVVGNQKGSGRFLFREAAPKKSAMNSTCREALAYTPIVATRTETAVSLSNKKTSVMARAPYGDIEGASSSSLWIFDGLRTTLVAMITTYSPEST
mmetsp:Transcript_20103/g.25921  ORF Transcript_20103/g.25921 Transcript_20103/m.25921 type:complete len:152 (+) Transcript_20103:301-756(+)